MVFNMKNKKTTLFGLPLVEDSAVMEIRMPKEAIKFIEQDLVIKRSVLNAIESVVVEYQESGMEWTPMHLFQRLREELDL